MQRSSNKLPTLEAVSQRFAQWRHNRPHLRAAIPESLWCEAISLLNHYSMTDIARELKVKPQHIREKANSNNAPEFVNVSLPQALESPDLRAELVHPDGLILKIRSISDKQFDSLVSHFISGR